MFVCVSVVCCFVVLLSGGLGHLLGGRGLLVSFDWKLFQPAHRTLVVHRSTFVVHCGVANRAFVNELKLVWLGLLDVVAGHLVGKLLWLLNLLGLLRLLDTLWFGLHHHLLLLNHLLLLRNWLLLRCRPLSSLLDHYRHRNDRENRWLPFLGAGLSGLASGLMGDTFCCSSIRLIDRLSLRCFILSSSSFLRWAFTFFS